MSRGKIALAAALLTFAGLGAVAISPLPHSLGFLPGTPLNVKARVDSTVSSSGPFYSEVILEMPQGDLRTLVRLEVSRLEVEDSITAVAERLDGRADTLMTHVVRGPNWHSRVFVRLARPDSGRHEPDFLWPRGTALRVRFENDASVTLDDWEIAPADLPPDSKVHAGARRRFQLISAFVIFGATVTAPFVALAIAALTDGTPTTRSKLPPARELIGAHIESLDWPPDLEVSGHAIKRYLRSRFVEGLTNKQSFKSARFPRGVTGDNVLECIELGVAKLYSPLRRFHSEFGEVVDILATASA